MSFMEIAKLVAALALFLYGMKLMGEGLEAAAGSKFKKILGWFTKNRFLAVATGALLTAIIQSSSATSVMTVGFVNSGLLNLVQAAGVIMGANIGTTITGLIVSLNVGDISYIAIAIGLSIMIVAKKPSLKYRGQILAGLGILFFGMLMMTDILRPLRTNEFAVSLFEYASNPLIGILVGIVATALFQSSSAVTGIAIALGMSGVLGLQGAMFITYGANIGTCFTALISTIGASRTAKRAAILHLIFNCMGVILFTFITLMPFGYINFIETTFAASEAAGEIDPDALFPHVGRQIAIANIFFNVSTTIVLLPFLKGIVKIATLIVPVRENEGDSEKLVHLDSRMLTMPKVVVEQIRSEVERMARLALDNYRLSVDMFLNRNTKLGEQIKKNEKTINFLNHEITKYLVRVTAMELEESDRKLIGSFHHVLNDIERIGDHAENIMEFSMPFIENKKLFSEVAVEELRKLSKEVDTVLENAIEYLVSQKEDYDEIAQIKIMEDEIDGEVETLKNNHVQRLEQGVCTPESGMLFVNMLGDFERVSDHASNIATYRGKKKAK